VREGASREERRHLASARGETIENGRGRWGEKRDEDHQPHVRARSEGPEPALEVGWRPLESPAESLSCISVDEKIILTHLGMVNRATTSQVLFPISCLSFALRRHLFSLCHEGHRAYPPTPAFPTLWLYVVSTPIPQGMPGGLSACQPLPRWLPSAQEQAYGPPPPLPLEMGSLLSPLGNDGGLGACGLALAGVDLSSYTAHHW
jgi:hypothetical protein